MSSNNIYAGYSGQVWQNCYAALCYYLTVVYSATTPQDTASTTLAMFNTLINGVAAIDASVAAATWNAEFLNLESIQALPIEVSPDDASILNNRTEAYAAVGSALAALIPQAPFGDPFVNFPVGKPTIPDIDLLSFYMAFDYETPPDGLTMDNFLAQAGNVAMAFGNIATAIQIFQGINLTQAYDIATRQQLVANTAYSILNSFTSGPLDDDDPVEYTWNQVVTLPAFTMDSSLVGTAPYSIAAQQNGVLRNTMLTMAQQLAEYLLILRTPNTSQISQITVRNDETLMDIANRQLGNYEEWTEIANTNNLLPPWTGSDRRPNLAQYGSELIMPTPGTAPSAVGQPPSYIDNFLGIDWYLGPVNGDMPDWTGDIQTIAGYNNLSIALGRRLQTTIGTLLYHAEYGSRIPPEVGNIQNSETAAHIAAYAQSALLADPRVQAVLSANAAVGTNGRISFQGVVQPAGFGGKNVALNEVISPLP